MNNSSLRRVYGIIRELTPPALFPKLIQAAVFAKYSLNPRSKDPFIEDLLSLRRSDEAFIIATGPSLNKLDLSFLSGKDVFSVSNFFLHQKITAISPLLHFFAPYHEPLVLSEYVNWLSMADKSLPDSTRIVLGHRTKDIVSLNTPFSSTRKIHYIWLEKSQFGQYPNLRKPILGPQSSPLMVIPVLISMGYKSIYLLGCDHNILKNYGGVVENFYEPSEDPRNNATSGKNWQDGIIKHLEYAHTVFKQYSYYQTMCKSKGISIFNMSGESWLDFLDFCSPEDYLNIHKDT